MSLIKWSSVPVYLMLATVFILAIVSCSDQSRAKIGVITILTGEGANYGKETKRGIEMALEDLRSAGGRGVDSFDLLYQDSEGRTEKALDAFRSLADIYHVPVVIGPFLSSELKAIAPIAEDKKTVVISGSTTADYIRDAGEYIFRVCSSNDVQGKSVAQFALSRLNARTAYILYQNNEYGVNLRQVFAKEFQAGGGTIMGEEAFPPGITDLRSPLAKVKAANPDVVFAPAHYSEAGLMLRQAKELGIKAVFVGGDGAFDPELIKIAGNASEGSYWATVGWGSGNTKSLAEGYKVRYKAKYGEDAGVYSALYYDAMRVVALAISKGASTGTAIKDALLQIHDYRGPTGTTDFDNRGEVDKPFSMYQIRNGQFVLVE